MAHMDVVTEIIDKLRDAVPALDYPNSTFEINTSDCEEGFIKLIAYDQLGGNVTGTLNCDEVNIAIEIASLLGGAES